MSACACVRACARASVRVHVRIAGLDLVPVVPDSYLIWVPDLFTMTCL